MTRQKIEMVNDWVYIWRLDEQKYTQQEKR